MHDVAWLAENVCVADDFLSGSECAALIARSEALRYEAALVSKRSGPIIDVNIRNNDRVILDDPMYASELWEKLRNIVPATFHRIWHACGINERLRFYRYEPGQYFDWHSDGSFWRSQREESHFTFMVYLNEDCEGGETTFRGLPDHPHQDLVVTPKKGMALIFRHPLWHRGSEVRHGRKYVLRSDIMYRLDPDSDEGVTG
ncbi:prolyl hydroxylase family protein [uncultured Sphingomonas sp.]|uniref:prolyl hydroxylase family protein n=1 Tax=uncultured Sphingomonas sp. TaxID=158754 RepID=UPI0035CB7FB9